MPAQHPHSRGFFGGSYFLAFKNVWTVFLGTVWDSVQGQELVCNHPYGPLANQDILGYFEKSVSWCTATSWCKLIFFVLFLLPALDTQQFISASVSCGSCLLEQLCSQMCACPFLRSLPHPWCPQKESHPFQVILCRHCWPCCWNYTCAETLLFFFFFLSL